MADNIVEMRSITKRFPGVTALNGVDFRLERGEIHALMGENGAGKSTLIKVMTGMYPMDGGAMLLGGRPIAPRSVFQMQSAGISTIYQEINLIPHMSVCENIVLGREDLGRLRNIRWRPAREAAKAALARLGLAIDVGMPLNRYSTAVQQMVAIARALTFEARVVVMDEPTSSLNEGEIRALFKLVRGIRDQGMSFIFVSHKLREVYDLCQSVTILRDGRLEGRYRLADLGQVDLVAKMIGKSVSAVGSGRTATARVEGGKHLCSLEGVKAGARVKGISFSVAEGEIVGLAGLLGSGRTETLELLFGVESPDAGVIRVDGVETVLGNPRDAIGRGFAFCPEDRKVAGIMPSLSLADNIAVANMASVSRLGVVSRSGKRELARSYMEKLGIKAYSPAQSIGTMSGGNQQKVILSRWLASGPRLILLDEPTRGIDVGAKAEILGLVREMAAGGMSVVVVSSEWEELLQVCDRILVYKDGVNVRELPAGEWDDEGIINAIAGA